MSSCEKYQELISRLVDDELNPREEALLNEHIKSCPACAALYRAFSALSDQIGADLEEAPLDLKANIMAEIRRGEIRKKNLLPTVLRYVMGAAACLAVVAGVVLGVEARSHVPAAAFEKSAGTASFGFAAESTYDREEAVSDAAPAAGEIPATQPTIGVNALERAAEPEARADTASDQTAPHEAEEEATQVAELDFSDWMDLPFLRELLGGQRGDLTREDLEEDLAWLLTVSVPDGTVQVPVYSRGGLLYYCDPLEDAVYLADLSPAEFLAFLEN